MNKISFGQFASLLLASDAFALICYSDKISLVTLWGFLISILIQFIISLFLIKKDIPSDNKFLLCIYLLCAVIWGALLFIRVWNISEAIYIPVPKIKFLSENLIISALIAVVCLYASSPGIKAVSRASVITAGFGVFCFITILFGSFKNIDKSNLFISSQSGISNQILSGLAVGGSFCTLPFLISRLKGSKIKSTVFYFICRSVFYTAVIILTLLVAGGIMQITKFPVIRAVELCQPFSTQRIDSLFIIVLVILAVMGISVQTVTASQITAIIFPKFRRFKSTVIIIAMILFSLLLGKTDIYSTVYSLIFIIPPVLTVLFMIVKKEYKR